MVRIFVVKTLTQNLKNTRDLKEEKAQIIVKLIRGRKAVSCNSPW